MGTPRTGADAGAFNIDANGQVKLNSAANFETKASYSLSVRATDASGNQTDKAITINVSNVNEVSIHVSLVQSAAKPPPNAYKGLVVSLYIWAYHKVASSP